MTQHDRRRAAMSHAFKYQEYKAAVAAYIDWALAQGGKQQLTGTPVSGGHRSDPTANSAIKLVDMPEHIRTKAQWVRAINDAWRECAENDAGNKFGMAFLFEKNFRLTGETLGREHNAAVRMYIIESSGISQRRFYERLEDVCDILVYHAAKRKLL